MSTIGRAADQDHLSGRSSDHDARPVSREVAPGKRARTDEQGGGAAVQRKSSGPSGTASSATGAHDRAGDWAMSDGMISAMGLGNTSVSAGNAAPFVQLRAAGSSAHRAVQAHGGDLAGPADSVAATADRGVAGASAKLPHADAIQRSFGRHDVSGVRAQVGGEAAASSKALGAEAYATGDRVAFAQAPDLHTAAHEAAHVVQQAAGVHLKDGLGQVGDLYEQHADAVADAVVAGKSAEALLDGFASPAHAAPAQEGGDVQRKAVQLVASDYKSNVQLKAMTLSQFDSYASAQADWATSTTLAGDKANLRKLLTFARKSDGQVLNACGGFGVQELLNQAAGQGTANDARLTAYSRSAGNKNQGTVHVDLPAANAQQAVDWGEALLAMHAVIPGTILERVVSQNGTIAGLRLLVDNGAVDDFVKYYRDVRPLLDASNGMEVISFLLFLGEGGPGKCGGYKASLPEIRNYHRFTVPQLDALAANRVAAATNKAQVAPLPVCVVLQTAMDHNGAFHRDDHMTDVINRVTHITLVAEGKPSLAEFSAELAKFAAFGRGDKVDEVMVSGHGNAKLMELAGDKDVGRLKSTGEEIYYNSKNERVTVDQDPRYTSDAHRAATDDFIASIKDVLRDDAASRVVLNACLTASNSVDGIVLSADPDTAAKQIRDAIAKDPSLATAMKTKMGAHQGQVRGSNASFGREATLVNGTGSIDIDSVQDPKLTSSKLEYTEAGTEPTGALRATLESWGTDRVATLAAVNRRIVAKGGDTSWREKVIIAAMKIIAAHPDDAALISKLIGSVGALSHLTGRPECKVSALKNQVPDAHLDAIFTDLTTSVTWTSAAHNYVPAVVFQVWIEKNHAKIGDFLTFLDGSSFTTQNARAFFDLGHLAPLLPQLLVAPSATPPRGSFLIALLYLANQEDGAPAAAKKYIKDVVGVGNQIFPGTSNVDALLTSASPQSVLEDAGVVPKAGVPVLAPLGVVAPLGPTPNLDPTHSGNNTLAVDSLSMSCVTHGLTATNAYMLPAGNKIGDIPSGTSLNIIGKTRGMKKGFFSDSPNTEFFAVERTIGTNQTVFVAVADVRVS